MTRGLNADVALKHSGVEWLGEVPEHWEVLPLKRFLSLQSGDTITSERIYSQGAYAVYGGNGLRGYTDAFTHDGSFVLIGRQGALCGNINYANGKFWASEHAVVVTPNKPLIVRWAGELLSTMNLNQYSVSAAQPGLSVDIIRNLSAVFPPLAEQEAIVEFLDAETQRIDNTIAKAQRSIELMQERRSALISAVVTGKIDVRKRSEQRTH